MSRINTNVPAMNTLRQLGGSSKMFSRSIGRLSSGFRINRAADDAAGLGIANTLRADIRATRQAARNTEQGNSVLQVMEGGAQQVTGILERMKELAAQAGSDSVDNQARVQLNAEFDQLSEEVDRIVRTTKFQGQALLDGTYGSIAGRGLGNSLTDAQNVTGVDVTVAEGAQDTVDALTSNITLAVTQDAGTISTQSVSVISGFDGGAASITVTGQPAFNGLNAGSYSLRANGTQLQLVRGSDNTVVESVALSAGGADLAFAAAGVTVGGDGTNTQVGTLGTIGTFTVQQQFDITATGGNGSADDVFTDVQLDGSGAETLALANRGLQVSLAAGVSTAGVLSLGTSNNVITIQDANRSSFMVSASGDYTSNDLIELSAVNLNSAQLGVDSASVDLTSGTAAQTALTAIDNAINRLSDTFAQIGAAQNRMEFAFANAQSMVENLSSAESVIRDVDMAEEVTSMTKYQILQQAGTAMLAQANSAPQNVLSLLR
jgi:flagellin